ncbi:hypothetical protein DFH06DRAFT_1335716 [Mycena polygramma]|nr:hypothetical protein DFH06DRAFT_1335716 [Mycena polygramma]
MDPHLKIPTPARGFLLANRRTESSFEQIPVIDFTDATITNHVKRRDLADKIRDAFGFFYVKNHPIPQSTIANAVSAAGDFFALPADAKLALDIHKSANFKGYTALLGENTNPEGRGDLHEGFDIGWEEHGGGPMAGVNVWPLEAELPGFRDRVLEYYQAAVRFGQSLFPLFALALDLPENFFDDKVQCRLHTMPVSLQQLRVQTTKPAAIMRLLHYPPQAPAIDDDGRIIGIGAHTEYLHF